MDMAWAIILLAGGLVVLWKAADLLVSGAVELIVCVKTINESVIPPTINLENQDERCDLKMDYVPLQAKQRNIKVALSNSLGFGGHNACLVVGKV